MPEPSETTCVGHPQPEAVKTIVPIFLCPNDPVHPDCMANFTGTDPVARSSGHGLSTARSRHVGGVNAWYCDGSVHTVADTVDLEVWRALATRAGWEVVQQ